MIGYVHSLSTAIFEPANETDYCQSSIEQNAVRIKTLFLHIEEEQLLPKIFSLHFETLVNVHQIIFINIYNKVCARLETFVFEISCEISYFSVSVEYNLIIFLTACQIAKQMDLGWMGATPGSHGLASK